LWEGTSKFTRALMRELELMPGCRLVSLPSEPGKTLRCIVAAEIVYAKPTSDIIPRTQPSVFVLVVGYFELARLFAILHLAIPNAIAA
jgi:hypothetical protein